MNFPKEGRGKRKRSECILLVKIKSIFEESRKTYGSPRIQRELIRQGISCSRKRVAKIMRKEKIQPKMRKKWKTSPRDKTTESPNYLDQEFTASAPNAKLVSDITYVKTMEGWLYVAGVMDLFSRKIIGLCMG